METLEVLQQCTVEGAVVKLPNIQLDRKDYEQEKKKLELIGGKWKGGKVAGFVFPTDPTALLEQIAGGENRNLKKEFQFFATPAALADRMVNIAGLKEGDNVLEPSAGQGAIMEAVYRAFPRTMEGPNDKPSVSLEYCELMDVNRSVISQKLSANKNWTGRTSWLSDDFFDAKPYAPFDAVIANPPFTKNQDIDHIRKMFEVVKPGGRIVTIASPSWTFGSQKKQVEFREWLDEIGAEQEELPQGTFKESGTNIKAVLLVIDKPAA